MPSRQVLRLEGDDLEIIAEECIEVNQGEFTVPKKEEE